MGAATTYPAVAAVIPAGEAPRPLPRPSELYEAGFVEVPLVVTPKVPAKFTQQLPLL